MKSSMTRRQLFEQFGAVAAMSLVARPLAGVFGDGFPVSAQALPLTAIAGVDRVVMKHGRTYLNGWAGYGEPPRRGRTGRGAAAAPPPPPPSGPAPSTVWSKVSGPGAVTFADRQGRGHDRDVFRRPAPTSSRSRPTTARPRPRRP